jgi:nitroreductase
MAQRPAEKRLSEILVERRATPHFAATPVHEEDLRKILQAGLEAPSGYNLQPWRFVVVRDAVQRKNLRPATMGQVKVEEAPVVIVACGDAEGWRDPALREMLRISKEHGFGGDAEHAVIRQKVYAAFEKHPNIALWLNRHVMIAFTHMMLMAEALGYDTAPMEGFFEDKVKALLKIPEQVRVVAILCIGRRAGEDKPYAGRLPLAHTVYAEEWGRVLEF